MPESVSGVDDLVAGLRKTSKTFTRPMTGETYEVVTLADAEAAVHAAADARTQEIVAMLREEADDRMVSDFRGRTGLLTGLYLIARRFPNEGTHAPHGDRPAHERGGRA